MAPQDPSIATQTDASFSPDTEARIDACVQRAIDVLRAAPSALLTDIDGTICEMAPAPNLALIDPGALESLEVLSRGLALVGVVTGRSLADALRLTGRPDLVHVGNHGYERVRLGVERSTASVAPYFSAVAEAAEAVRSAASFDVDLDGVIVENKRFTASFHYRLAPDAARAQTAIRRIIEPIAMAAELKISEGKMVIELRPPLTVNKGVAIAEIIAEHELKGLVFFGDDVTDVDGFKAVRAHNRFPDFQGLTVAIVTTESSPAVAEAADLRLHGVRECIEVLRRLAVVFSASLPARQTGEAE